MQFYDPSNPKHKLLKSKRGKQCSVPHSGEMTRYNYVQRIIITYIDVDCYEHNFRYGSDEH